MSPIKRPRKLGEVAEAIVKLLHERRITGAQFFKSKHARVEFEHNGKLVVFYFACTPKDPTAQAQRARRNLTAIIDGTGVANG